MQRAALEQGVNVARTDVVFELASRVGLSMNDFSAAFHSEETRRLILDEHRLAASRGVRGVPTLVIGGRWMICGLRDIVRVPRAHPHLHGEAGGAALGLARAAGSLSAADAQPSGFPLLLSAR